MAMLPDKPEDGDATVKHVEEMEGVKEEDLQAKAEEAEQELEDKTEARLAAVMAGEKLPEEEPEPDPAEESEEEEESTPDKDDKPADKSDEEDEPTLESGSEEKAEEEEEGKEAKKEDTPPLSDAYYRAAAHAGWTPEAIKEFYEATPELCVKTLSNVHETMNRSSQIFASHGRARREQEAMAAQPKPTATEAAAAEFKGIDVRALENSDADEATIAALKAIDEQNRANFEARQKTEPAQVTVQPSGLTPQQQQFEQQRKNMLASQIETFFNDKVKGYEEFYGIVKKDATDWSDISPGQHMNRWTMCQMMDEMMIGAEALGREITVDEALQRAHLSVSVTQREKVMREELKGKITKRSKSLTLQPSGTAKQKGGKPQTEQELQDRTQSRLDKLAW